MKYKSDAITLTYIKYGESSIVSKIFTKEKGLQTFMVKGVRSKKSKKKISYFEPLKLLTVDAKYTNTKSMHYVEEINIVHLTENSIDKINRNFIAYFIAEICSKVLQDNEHNHDLFDYLWILSIKLFNSEKINPNFAILFLLDLSKFLGFYPSLENLEQSFFAIKNSYTAIKRKKNEEDYFNQKSNFLKEIIRGKKVIMPQKIRSEILKDFLKYYKLNYYNLDNVTSHLIIEELR